MIISYPVTARAGKLPDDHTITITVTRDKEKGKETGKMALPGGEMEGENVPDDVKNIEDQISDLAKLNADMLKGTKEKAGQKPSEKKAASSPGPVKVGGCVFTVPTQLSNFRKGLADLPGDIPELQDATFGESFDHKGGKSFQMGSMKSPLSLKSSYKKQLQNKGWEILRDDAIDTRFGKFQRLFAKTKNACISVVSAKATVGLPNKSVLSIYTYPGPGIFKGK